MQVLHISAECYPAAKAGGLGDVVGALPKYLKNQDVDARVIMPKYDNDWIRSQLFRTVHEGIVRIGENRIAYRIVQEKKSVLGFPLFMVDIQGLFDRPGIYTDPSTGEVYADEFDRYVSFQSAVLDWLKSRKRKPDIIHCHDHHTAFIPLLMSGSPAFHEFSAIPSVLTVHNGQYHGWYDADSRSDLPVLTPEKEGYLYWNGQINALACGLRTCWELTTVSKTYLKELQSESLGLEGLFEQEAVKSRGIVNGIDVGVWDPRTDPLIRKRYTRSGLIAGKQANKQYLCDYFSLNPDLPLISFIGRLTSQKGADLLPDLITRFLDAGNKASFVVLGTGDKALHTRLTELKNTYVGYFDAGLEYNEPLAHNIYAGSDFHFMPSRFEPCGLNQMYAMRYGTIPVVRSVGGLRDSVIDLKQENGYGILFDDFTLEDAHEALDRALTVYEDIDLFRNLQRQVMSLDFSWRKSARSYKLMYMELMQRGG